MSQNKPPVAAGDDNRPSRKTVRPGVVLVALTLVMVMFAFVVVGQANRPRLVGGVMTRSFGAPSACTSASIPLTPAPGVDLARSGEPLLDSLAGIAGIGTVRLRTAEQTLEVEFCDSSTSEREIHTALVMTGLVRP